MNLLPIIYTSLVLFTGFVVFVITISYISYKIREKNRTDNSSVQLDLKASYIPKQQTNFDYAYELEVKQEREYALQQMELRRAKAEQLKREAERTAYNRMKQNTMVLNSKIENPVVERRTKIEMPQIQNRDFKPEYNNSIRFRTTSARDENRFNVVNNNFAFASNAGTSKPSINLLNYYADDDEIGMPPTYSQAI